MDSKSSKINNFSFRFALLSISLVLTSANALSPAIPQMIKSFPDQSVSSIELLVTVPAFSVMILVLLSSYISKKVGEKLPVCIGLVLVTVFGIFPFFTSSYMLILVSRIFLGAGFGLINSFAVSLISEFYKGSQKASMMGFRSGFEGLGQAIMTFVAGLLLAFGWKYTTLVYLIAIPIFLLFYYYIPSNKKSQNLKNDADKVKNNIKQKISLPVWGIAIFLFLIVIFYVGMTVRFPLIVTSYHLGNAEDASRTLSIMAFSGMLLGCVFGFIYKTFKKYTLSLGIFCMAASNIIVNLSHIFIIVSIGAILSGIAYAIIVAYMFSLISDVSSLGSNTLSTSVVIVGCNLGALLAPYGLKIVATIFNNNSISLPFIVYGVILLMMGVGSLFLKKSV